VLTVFYSLPKYIANTKFSQICNIYAIIPQKKPIIKYDWPTLLYPAEWCFRFFVASVLILIVSGLSTPISQIGYWTMAAAAIVAFLFQVRIVVLFATGRILKKGENKNIY